MKKMKFTVLTLALFGLLFVINTSTAFADTKIEHDTQQELKSQTYSGDLIIYDRATATVPKDKDVDFNLHHLDIWNNAKLDIYGSISGYIEWFQSTDASIILNDGCYVDLNFEYSGVAEDFVEIARWSSDSSEYELVKNDHNVKTVKKSGALSSTISAGSIWIIGAIVVVVASGVIAFVIYKNKLKKK